MDKEPRTKFQLMIPEDVASTISLMGEVTGVTQTGKARIRRVLLAALKTYVWVREEQARGQAIIAGPQGTAEKIARAFPDQEVIQVANFIKPDKMDLAKKLL